MGKSLNQTIKRELENLDKDPDSRREAMTALKSFVKDLDSNSIPLFLSEVSRSKESGSLSGECMVSLYEFLARSHGAKIVPFIDTIMDSIIKTLASSAGSFSVQKACSNLVPTIARYSINPSTQEDTKRHIVHSLTNPLLGSLLSSQESLSSGASLCLKALVENDNWKFASFEMVNKVCQNVAAALEEGCAQGNSQMGLVMALAKRNAVAVEPYARLLVQSGLRILEERSPKTTNSQKRISAIQMINFLMKSLDPRSIVSEIRSIIKGLEDCQSDQMGFVKGAALEALQTARSIVGEENGAKLENGGPGSVTGSNFSRRFLATPGDQSPAASPLSRTFNSMVDYDYSFNGSPILSTQDMQMFLDSDSRSMDHNIWSLENGNVSFRNGVASELERSNGVSNVNYLEQSGADKFVQSNGNHEQDVLGFSRTKPRHGISRSATTSPIRSRTPMRVDTDGFRTPRNNTSRAGSDRPPVWSRNNFRDNFDRSAVSRCEACEWRENESLREDVKHFHATNGLVSPKEEDIRTISNLQEPVQKKTVLQRVGMKLVCGVSIALLAVVTPIALLSGHDEGSYLVPT